MSDKLLAALEKMCEEFRGYDLPYGSEAYHQAISAINEEKARRDSGPDHSIWCVSGHAGEWSDKYEWIVCWLPTEEEAIEFRTLCQAAGDKASVEHDKADGELWDEYNAGTLGDDAFGEKMDAIREKFANEYDPAHDKNGTYYRIEKVSKAVWKAATK